MIATDDPASHEEAWLVLPWLASGRLSQPERDKIEPHVRACATCREELAFQRLLCNALGEPDRVTYAPGPSFRKLMERIDGSGAQASPLGIPSLAARSSPLGIPSLAARSRKPAASLPAPTRSRRTAALHHSSLWRPPGLAWAAWPLLWTST